MNIDEQIRKIINIDELEINQYVPDEMITKIKQSILKAIMEKMPKPKYEDMVEVGMDEFQRIEINRNQGFNRCQEEFESVIKEVLK